MRTTTCLLVSLITGLVGSGTSSAQTLAETWPQRIVRLIVPNSPGTATDATARFFAERLSARYSCRYQSSAITRRSPRPDCN